MPIKPETKKILANSFESLAKVKPIGDITVEDILYVSGSSRSTFYRHFRDKYDLMTWIYKDRVDTINSGNIPCERRILEITYFIKEKQNYLYHISKYEGQNSFHNFLFHFCCDFYEKYIKKKHNLEKIPDELTFTLKFYVAGMVHMTCNWIKSDFQQSCEEFSSLLWYNMHPDIKKYFID